LTVGTALQNLEFAAVVGGSVLGLSFWTGARRPESRYRLNPRSWKT
jgi:hypothetical protein